MFLQQVSALFNIALGMFLLIFIGGKLLLQLLAIIFGFWFIFRGLRKFGFMYIKASMNNFCDL